MSDDSLDDFTKFRIQKDNYEYEKTLILQKDEVKRLKDELNLIHTHIQNSKQNFRQTKAIYKKKAKSIKKEIESVPVSTSIITSNLNKIHTKTINTLKHEHHKILKGIRIQFSEKMNLIKTSEADYQIISNSNSEYDHLNDVYVCQNFQNTEEYELEIQSRLSVLNQQIALRLIKCEELQEEIDKINKTINKERQKLFNQISNIQKNSNHKLGNSQNQIKNHNIDKQKEEQTIEREYQAKESFERDRLNNEINQLRSKVEQVRAKSQELKVKIEAKYTDSSPKLNESMQSLSSLQAAYQQMLNESHSQIFIEKNIHTYKKTIKKTVNRLRISIIDFDEVQKEHDSLLEEIKRLDFMIYGRRGRFQTINKTKKRNHWIG